MNCRLSFILIFILSCSITFSQQVKLEKTCFSTNWEDYGPRIVADKLYCLSASFDGDSTIIDPNTMKPFSDVYLVNGCILEHATFTTISFGEKTSMSSNFYDGPLTGNANILFFTNNHGIEHNVRLGIFYAFKKNDKWTDALTFPFNSLDYNVSHPFYDEKNGMLYFVSDKGSVEKNQDIYYCTFDGKKFGLPKKIEAVNSSLNELAPLVYKDTLYFTSNGFNSIGGYDLFKLVGDTVVSMGPQFNSNYDDLSLMFDSDTSGYFTSDRSSKGYDDDIFRFVIVKDPIEAKVDTIDTLTVLTMNSKENALAQLVDTKLMVDSLRNLAIEAGVSPDLFSFLNLNLAQYEKNFPKGFEGKSLEEINAKIAELRTVISLINQQINIVTPQKPIEIIIKPQLNANNDFVTTNEDEPIIIDLLSNDSISIGKLEPSSIDIDPYTFGLQKTLTNSQGSWKVESGKLIYSPAYGYVGTATLTYNVSDNIGNVSNVALINVNVKHLITGPCANNDVAETKENKTVKLSILANDTTTEGTLDFATIDFDLREKGIQQKMITGQGVWIIKNGDLFYTPASKFKGSAFLFYTVKNTQGVESNVANITINVAAEPIIMTSKVTANNDIANTNQGQPIQVNVLLNDIDSEGSIDSTSIDLEPTINGIQSSQMTTQGNWMVTNGQVNFIPNSNFLGKASTSYTVQNKIGIGSNIATISIDVIPVISAPVVKNITQSTKLDQPTTLDILANFSGSIEEIDLTTIDLDPNKLGSQQEILNSQGTWKAENGKVTYLPTANFIGTSSIPYSIKNLKGIISNVALLTVVVSSEANQIASSDKDSSKTNLPLDVVNSLIDQSKIENIHFRFDSYEIIQQYRTYLRGLSMLFKANPQWKIHLAGHTDNIGSAAYNIELSKNRSIATKNFLVECGILEDRITYEYHGLERPIATNSTSEGRYENRRVEIAVYLNGKTIYNTEE